MGQGPPARPGPAAVPRLDHVDLDVSRGNWEAHRRFAGWQVYICPAVGAWFIGLALFMLVDPPPHATAASQLFFVVPILALGGLMLAPFVLVGIFRIPLTAAQRKASRDEIRRVVGDAQRMAFVRGDGREFTFSIMDSEAWISLRCPRTLLEPGLPRSRYPPILTVGPSRPQRLSAPLTLEGFETLRELLLSSGAETYEDKRASVTSTPTENGRTLAITTPTYILSVGKAARDARFWQKQPQWWVTAHNGGWLDETAPTGDLSEVHRSGPVRLPAPPGG